MLKKSMKELCDVQVRASGGRGAIVVLGRTLRCAKDGVELESDERHIKMGD